MTLRIQLIVTGDLERLALHLSLQRLFAPTGAAVEFLKPLKTQDFTSNRVGKILTGPAAVKSLASKLANRFVTTVYPGRRGTEQADFVIAVDDLELANADQPAHVINYFRHAVRACVEESYSAQSAQERVYRALAERGSFHLLAPMAEAYFFGEPAALTRAKADVALNRFSPTRDVEAFEVDDSSYMALTPPTVDWAPHPRHPKNYVRYLCDPRGQLAQKEERGYRETHAGLDALKTLDWKCVLQNPGHAAFARSLIDDIADALNVPSPCPGPGSPLTARGAGEGLLRNI